MKNLYYFYIAVGVLLALLILDQIWTGIIGWEIAWKLILTLGILGGLVVAIQLIREELLQDRKDRDDKYLD